MDWDRLKTFYTVASLGSLSAAEQTLHITQSALSRQISQLEHEVRTKLFERHARGLKLTEAGHALFPAVEKVYRELVAIQTLLTEQQDRASGKLTLIVPRAFASFWLIPHLGEFNQRHPCIQIALVSDDSLSVNHALREGVYAQISFSKPLDRPELVCKSLCSHSHHIYAGQGYLSTHGTPRSVKELDKHQIIAYHGAAPFLPLSEQALNPLLFIGRPLHRPRKHAFLTDDIHGQLVAAKNNLGLITAPSYIAAQTPELQQIRLVDGDIKNATQTSYYLLFPEHLQDFERIRALQEFLEEKITELKDPTYYIPSSLGAPQFITATDSHA